MLIMATHLTFDVSNLEFESIGVLVGVFALFRFVAFSIENQSV